MMIDLGRHLWSFIYGALIWRGFYRSKIFMRCFWPDSARLERDRSFGALYCAQNLPRHCRFLAQKSALPTPPKSINSFEGALAGIWRAEVAGNRELYFSYSSGGLQLPDWTVLITEISTFGMCGWIRKCQYQATRNAEASRWTMCYLKISSCVLDRVSLSDDCIITMISKGWTVSSECLKFRLDSSSDRFMRNKYWRATIMSLGFPSLSVSAYFIVQDLVFSPRLLILSIC